ncbi:eukaryotic translation initiation factor 2-alpha kinase [Naegleria gruberi]|uniref:non-specific serine/threonine protein kinase n=1 Tax=Naegleria gruberi TaxID=5762 RepID=D2VIH6_NAEGR|nr:eukaryotic translation initiation factor 2-alpha kinase [Naegleria gruberi]EFC43268.1 eukaryotic translation initiation factor 2-alpha kinase [Naegleria gruberi]|eukprot:XP_002676012.1 eukaryotic translation initiation factor 2-alpha kinase [Naegleria gruberi strain NEG-M]
MKSQKTISIPTPTPKRSSRNTSSDDDDDDDSDSLTFSRNRNYGPTSSSLNSSLFKNTLLNNREAYQKHKLPSLTTTTAPSLPKTQQKTTRSASITTNNRKPSPSLLQPPISSSLLTPNFLSNTNNLKDSEKLLLDFVQVYEKQQSLKSASSASNSSDKLSDDEDPYLILSSSFNQGGWEHSYSKLEEEILESPTITDPGNYSQSFHSISEISKNKQNKRNWFRFMKMEGDSLEDCSDDESSAPQVDKKEILLLFLLQHAANQLNPDMGFFVSLCKHLTHLGYFSNRMTDESFIKTLCKDFMEDITNIFPVSALEVEETNRGIVRSESYSSYLSDIPHSPGANREFFGALESSPVIDSMFYNAKRLESDYHHFQKLGKEKPYSSVIKAIHKIDGRAYAIKKVKFHFSNTFELEHVYSYVVNEIKNLAKLDNENIIRYNSAWFEPYRDNSLPSPSEKNLSCSHPECGSPIWSDSYVNSLNIENDLKNESLESKGKKTDVEFEFTPKRKPDIPPSPPPSMSYFEFALKRGKETSKRKSESIDSTTRDITSNVKSMLHEMFNVNNHFEMVLYIVMQLCEGTTLENWLLQSEKKKNRKTNLIDILKIFKRIVKGVCHIHERGLVHNNLKPNNIFVASNHRIKIADFGVAKYLQECLLNHKKCKNKESSPNRKRSHTFSEQGSLYASPEQIFNQKFDQKGDIYSLGVILFELISPPFVTTTERVHVLSQLRKREISEEMLKSFPREIEIIKQCLDKPNNRPTAPELLQKVTRLIKAYKIEGRFSSSGVFKHTNSSSNLHFPSFDTIREKNKIIEEQQRQIELLKEQLRKQQQ